MCVRRKLSVTNFIAFLFFFLPVSAAEEGWRYSETLNTKLQYLDKELEADFLQEHISMADIIRMNADSGQYSSMLRFTPVFVKGQALELGSTVCLKPIECLESPLPSYEVAFASGTYPRQTQDALMKCRTAVDIELLALIASAKPIVKPDLMTLRLPTHFSGLGKDKEYQPNTYPVRFMVANTLTVAY